MVTKEEVRGWMQTLALGQGWYGRRIEEFDQEPEKWEQLTYIVNEHGITDIVLFCMFIEG